MEKLKLNRKYGLLLQPKSDCSTERDDKFLYKFQIPEQRTIIAHPMDSALRIDSFAKATYLNNSVDSPRCITGNSFLHIFPKADIKHLLLQRRNTAKIIWDNSKLKFDTANHKSFYAFSIPLFTKDMKKFILKVEDLGASSLGGSGGTYLFTKENNNWMQSTLEY